MWMIQVEKIKKISVMVVISSWAGVQVHIHLSTSHLIKLFESKVDGTEVRFAPGTIPVFSVYRFLGCSVFDRARMTRISSNQPTRSFPIYSFQKRVEKFLRK